MASRKAAWKLPFALRARGVRRPARSVSHRARQKRGFCAGMRLAQGFCMQEEHAGWGQRVAGRIFGVSPAVLLGVFLCSLVVGPGFREDEVSCEEAVAHLDECCPDFDETPMNCTYGGDCSSVSTDFTAAES